MIPIRVKKEKADQALKIVRKVFRADEIDSYEMLGKKEVAIVFKEAEKSEDFLLGFACCLLNALD